MSSRTDFKHPDMQQALALIAERVKDAQRRRDHYKRMSGKQQVQVPDRFGNLVYAASDLVWLYENEIAALQRVYDDIYLLFRIKTSADVREALKSDEA
jgi:hypothetical protein